jgi:hypothetical protein
MKAQLREVESVHHQVARRKIRRLVKEVEVVSIEREVIINIGVEKIATDATIDTVVDIENIRAGKGVMIVLMNILIGVIDIIEAQVRIVVQALRVHQDLLLTLHLLQQN